MPQVRRNVQQVHNRHIVNKYKTYNNALLYLDPPYVTAKTSTAYGVSDFDGHALRDALRSDDIGARIAISGYNDEFDDLGWHKNERKVISPLSRKRATKYATEVLWTNYTLQPPQPRLF